METDDLLETLVLVGLIGILPYVAVETYDIVRRTIARHRDASRH